MSTPPVVEPLGPSHDRAAFSCGAESLDRYLKQQASQDVRNNVAAVFVLRPAEASSIIGYYTLSATGIELAALPDGVKKRLPRYPLLPAVLLGRLAVDQRHQGRGWGKVSLLDALRRGLQHRTQVAAMAVVVDAKDDAARVFYERYGFRRFLDNEYRLYLPMETVEQLFAAGS
ncbi:MAG TPA: GNAT family N-acetyltransferase [Chloroflexota bacterium]|nr:GNAT family N-acetyltransferase [Chloroflexota bacterium]